MDGGAWQATVHGVSKSRTRLSDFTYLLTYLVYIQTFKHYSLKYLGPFNLYYCAWESQYSYKIKKIIKWYILHAGVQASIIQYFCSFKCPQLNAYVECNSVIVNVESQNRIQNNRKSIAKVIVRFLWSSVLVFSFFGIISLSSTT